MSPIEPIQLMLMSHLSKHEAPKKLCCLSFCFIYFLQNISSIRWFMDIFLNKPEHLSEGRQRGAEAAVCTSACARVSPCPVRSGPVLSCPVLVLSSPALQLECRFVDFWPFHGGPRGRNRRSLVKMKLKLNQLIELCRSLFLLQLLGPKYSIFCSRIFYGAAAAKRRNLDRPVGKLRFSFIFVGFSFVVAWKTSPFHTDVHQLVFENIPLHI